MISRRAILRTGAVAAVLLARQRSACAANAPGISDTEIRIGQTMPYSGPVSAAGTYGKAEAACFRMINDRGGINGRKISLISLDDGYSPPKTVEQTRRLVEQDQVALIFSSVGTPTNTAIRAYLNDRKIPQLLIVSGAHKWGDPKHFPWTMSFLPDYQTEARIYAKHIVASAPNAKVGVLYQNDDFGKDFLIGLKAGLGAEHAALLIKEVSFEVTEPTIDSQIISLQASGADTVLFAATQKFAAQAIRKTYDIGWKPTRYLCNIASSVSTVMKPAGLDKGAGIITTSFIKDPADPRWKDDQGYKEWLAFMDQYLPGAARTDNNFAYGHVNALILVQVLTQCGSDLSRDNIMKQAANLKDFGSPMLLPGIKINTTPDNYSPIRQLQLQRFTGKTWELFGDVMRG